MKTIKKTVLLILVAILVLSVLPFGYAEEVEGNIGDEVIPEYQNASYAYVTLSISNSGTASITLYCTGKSGTTKISSVTYFKKYVNGAWQTVLINGASSASYSVNASTLSKPYTVSVGAGTYYAYTVYSVTRNGQTETFTVSSNTVSH